MPRAPRTRLDELLLTRGLAPTRSAARGLIMAGLVLVGGEISDKAGAPVSTDADVRLKSRPRFVSRGGDKLFHAIRLFGLDVSGASALDIGASTGGFVDCLLQSGAARVIALDVGRGQLHERLRADPRVHALDRVNARYLSLELLPYQPDMLTMDVSFISITKVLPAVVDCMAPVFVGAILVKPQFEVGPALVGSGGIVRDPAVHRRVLLERAQFVTGELSLQLVGICRSALTGADGNVEFFFHLSRGGESGGEIDTLEALVDDALAQDGTGEVEAGS
jgi:23S rRNA (cytidine1920-2'-O)/16S rRNA (cytidine1409-2'-O)-methyltransferase